MKRIQTLIFAVFIGIFSGSLTSAQTGNDESQIRAVIDAQSAAWNRADIPTFMKSYEDSPQTAFVGPVVHKGYQSILERYKASYSTSEQMGQLTFTDIDIRLLACSRGKPEYAVVTGSFHLQRTARGEAKKDEGVFSLVWHKSKDGWKIILDHSV